MSGDHGGATTSRWALGRRWAALGGRARAETLTRSRIVLAASVAYVVFGFVVTLAVRVDSAALLPAALLEFFAPNDKTNLAPYRVLHLLALAVIMVRLVPEEWSGLRSAMLRPAVVCGQRSLEVFCAGIFLSFVGHFILEMYSDALAMQIAVSSVVLTLMTCVAVNKTWSRTLDAPPPSEKRAAVPDQSPQGQPAVYP